VPILQQCDFAATFFITTGFLEKRGYLSKPQLRELSGLGFEIGCHSMTHPYLTDLDDQGLHREIATRADHLTTGRTLFLPGRAPQPASDANGPPRWISHRLN